MMKIETMRQLVSEAEEDACSAKNLYDEAMVENSSLVLAQISIAKSLAVIAAAAMMHQWRLEMAEEAEEMRQSHR